MPLNLSFSCSRYDRIAPLVNGDVRVEGVELTYLPLEPEEGFWRHTQHAEFDLCEMSLSGHMMRVARGDDRFVGLPVFTSRVFRHRNIVVRRALGQVEPKELAGMTLAVPEYHMTAALFMKGLLEDEYGVRAKDVNWVQAGQFRAGRVEREELHLPAEISLRVERDKTIEQMLESGEVDGACTPYTPRLLDDPDGPVRRLFEDPMAVEIDYYQRTGVYPIMHLLVLRRSLYERHPWLARSLVKGFSEAKQACMDWLPGVGGHLAVSVPFFNFYLEQTRELFGEDWWPYGVSDNRETLEAATRHSHAQGLSSRKLDIEELFAPHALDETISESDSKDR
jgi:4,5-dihydroxyphthalate decarboxylase